LILLTWGASTPEEVFSNALRQQVLPANGVSELPKLNPTFKGKDVDYIAEAIEHKEIGDAGEELVIQYEKQALAAAGQADRAAQVSMVKDGQGYDIISFNADGGVKYIEVKTTTAGPLSAFRFTINEYLFAERNPVQYCIYRLYHFNEDNNTADFYILTEPLKHLLLQTTDFKAYYTEVV